MGVPSPEIAAPLLEFFGMKNAETVMRPQTIKFGFESFPLLGGCHDPGHHGHMRWIVSAAFVEIGG
jgi:hypothetical protein